MYWTPWRSLDLESLRAGLDGIGNVGARSVEKVHAQSAIDPDHDGDALPGKAGFDRANLVGR